MPIVNLLEVVKIEKEGGNARPITARAEFRSAGIGACSARYEAWSNHLFARAAPLAMRTAFASAEASGNERASSSSISDRLKERCSRIPSSTPRMRSPQISGIATR